MENRIKKLDEKTISKIAAGEVVERPAQVIKELIENSIDAKSTEIIIDIENGGFDLIKIADNGNGIIKNDLILSIERHATSKLSQIEDLNIIYTLGFRGEALSSIAAVSKLSVASRANKSDGFRLNVTGGDIGKIEPYPMNKGTIITVEDIFFNVPARLAFQRRPATESAKIVELTVQHAMAHPNISFKLKNEDRMIINVPAVNDLRDRLFDLLGISATKLIPLKEPPNDLNVPGDESWSGWISPPGITRGRNDDIHILVNNRVVTNQPFSEAIKRGYHTRLMVGRHPIAILNLKIPANDLDVNVHPTKREIRLKNSWRVLQRLERCINYTLSSVHTSPEGNSKFSGIKSEKNYFSDLPKTTQKPKWAESASNQLTLEDQLIGEDSIKKEKIHVSSSVSNQKTLPGLDPKPISNPLSIEERNLHRYSGSINSTSPLDEPLNTSNVKNELGEMEPLCQFANTYIVVQKGKELLLIDQHALHERIRFEKLRYSNIYWNPQKRLLPLELELNPIESERLRARKNLVEQLGFKLQELKDNKWNLISQPSAIPPEKIIDFLNDLIQDLGDENRNLNTLEKMKDHIAFMQSCRGAVKANQILSLAEMRRLLSDMRTIENPWACVHGRPTALKISINELDKHFGRHG